MVFQYKNDKTSGCDLFLIVLLYIVVHILWYFRALIFKRILIVAVLKLDFKTDSILKIYTSRSGSQPSEGNLVVPQHC